MKQEQLRNFKLTSIRKVAETLVVAVRIPDGRSTGNRLQFLVALDFYELTAYSDRDFLLSSAKSLADEVLEQER